MRWTTTSMIAAFKRRAVIPDSQNFMSDQEILDFLNDCLRQELTPLIMRTKEEFFVHNVDYVNQSVLTLPERAVGMRIRRLQYSRDGRMWDLDRINPGLSNDYQNVNGTVVGYEFFDNTIKMVPASAVSGTLTYFRRPNQLTLASECSLVSLVAGNNVTVADGTIFSIGQKIDAISADVYHKSHADSREITGIAGNVLTLDDASDIVAGDTICPEGYTSLPQVPEDLVEIWIQLGIVGFAESSGYADLLAIAKAKAESLMIHMFQMISDRDDNSPKKTISRRNIWNFGNRRGV